MTMRRYRHVKRGTSYTLLGRAELQSSTALSEGAVLAIYADRECERLWARPVGEFFDGRFVRRNGGGQRGDFVLYVAGKDLCRGFCLCWSQYDLYQRADGWFLLVCRL